MSDNPNPKFPSLVRVGRAAHGAITEGWTGGLDGAKMGSNWSARRVD